MKNYKVNWKQAQEPPSYPKWLKSYHILIAAITVMMIFGAFIKHVCN